MKLVVPFSGGLASTVLLAALQEDGHGLTPLFLSNEHPGDPVEEAEQRAVDALCLHLGLAPLVMVRGHGLADTSVTLMSSAAATAIARGDDGVALAVHAGNAREVELSHALRIALRLGADGKPLELLTPFLEQPLPALLTLGASLGVPFASTWSCRARGDVHCGECPSCQARAEAFAAAGLEDPATYAAYPLAPPAPAVAEETRP